MYKTILPLLVSLQIHAFTCDHFARTEPLGHLPKVINEASGIEVSRAFQRYYHMNDGGNEKVLYVTKKNGEILQAVKITGEGYGDIEDLSLFSCGDNDCLLMAGIGDNHSTRSEIQLAIIKETENFPAQVDPVLRFTARYEDGPRDAEAIAVHPNGDIIIITKQYGKNLLIPKASRVYRLAAADWQNLENGGSAVFHYIGALDLKYINRFSWLGRYVTGMDISNDGKRFVIITYGNAVEFNFDVSKPLPKSTKEMKKNIDYMKIHLAHRIQQEAIAYNEDESGILYTTEGKFIDPFDPSFKRRFIGEVRCQ
jgi:hypothetical protein